LGIVFKILGHNPVLGMGEAKHYTGLPLSWYFWKPGTVSKFCKGQGKVRERAKIQGKVGEFV